MKALLCYHNRQGRFTPVWQTGLRQRRHDDLISAFGQSLADHGTAVFAHKILSYPSNISIESVRMSGTRTSGECRTSSSRPMRPVPTATERTPFALAARMSLG